MRSTAYSVMMTLLLLVPISAVPLMAIFGVPQFAPLVSSPLEESDDHDDWDRPARKKSRPAAQVDEADDEEVDVSADESLEWADDSQERPRPLRKHRPKARAAPRLLDEDVELSFAESDGDDDAKPPRKKKSPSRELRVEPRDDESLIQLASNEELAQEAPFAESASPEKMDDSAAAGEPADDAAIPGYRRQKTGARPESDPRESKPSSKKKKAAAPTEPLSWLKLSQRLNDFGIRNFRLESGEGEFTFTCTYTPSNSPHVTRKFEAVADDPLKAVAKVLAQVEEASQQKVMASPRRMSESR